MIETIGNYAESQSLCLGYRLLASLAVDHHARQVRYFRNPATVFLSTDLYSHPSNLRIRMYPNRGSVSKRVFVFLQIRETSSPFQAIS